MSEQIIIVCDEKGNPTGEYIPKSEGITGKGKRHLAITVVLQNNKSEVLLQKRKHLVFDNLWDFTGSTDNSRLKDGKNETFEEATMRCLKREYGILKVGNLRNLGGFDYFAKDGDHCENEYCAMMVGEYEGEVNLNPEVGYTYKWMDIQEFLEDIGRNPKIYAPWVIEGVKVLKQEGL
jgi:isopentenyldiphosphate isomerase